MDTILCIIPIGCDDRKCGVTFWKVGRARQGGRDAWVPVDWETALNLITETLCG